MSVISLLGPAFLMCILLAGIHCYLGLHVLARKIIFVDLALAQSAAFGLALSLLIGLKAGSLQSYLITLSSALFASVLFTLIAEKKKHLSQEAFIGIVYAFFSVLVILLFDKSAHGAEHIKQTLTGYLIWISWFEVFKVFCIYSVIACFYYFFQKKFWESSTGKENHWKWNLLFYVLFSFVISSSVSIVGVLLVFSFLIVPSFLSQFLFQTFYLRFLFGWFLAVILSLLALISSYIFNLPTSSFIVFTFTFLPIILLLGSHITNRIKKIV
ncbi:MAG: metal ABC transporter permease [Bdellovibrionales bacterium]|nr:metal ABC transporter permease [Bdellovibrionales bacterium]